MQDVHHPSSFSTRVVVAALLALPLTIGLAGTAHAAGATLTVATTGTDSSTCGASADPCLTIQQAVTNAAAGDTVQVEPGTYVGPVSITEALTLVGIPDTVGTLPTIDGGGAAAVDTPANITVSAPGGAVSIRELHLTDPAPDSSGNPAQIWVENTAATDSVTIADNVMDLTSESPSDPAQQALVGIKEQTNQGSLAFTGNTIRDAWQGLLLEPDYSPVATTVQDNTISGLYANHVSSTVTYPPEGIVAVADNAMPVSGQDIIGNTFTGYAGYGVVFHSGYAGTGCTDPTCRGNVQGSITDNTFTLGGSAGLYGDPGAAAILITSAYADDSATVELSGNAGTVTAPTVPLLQESANGGTITLTQGADANRIVPADPPTVTVNLPASVTTGAAPVTVNGSATNPSGTDLEHVRYDIALTGDPGLTAADVDLQVETSPGTFTPITLTGQTDSSGTAITGSFTPGGDPAGFTLTGVTLPTSFQWSIVAGAPTGALTVATTLDQVSLDGGRDAVNTLAGVTHTTTVTAPAPPPPPPPPATGTITPITPTRVLDTRSGNGPLGSGPLQPGTTYTLHLSDTGLPLNQAAYVLNVTVLAPDGVGNLAIGPDCGAPAPTTSLVNYQPGADVANDVVLPNPVIDATTTPPTRCNAFTVISRNSAAGLVLDAQGYIPGAAGFTGGGTAPAAHSRSALAAATSGDPIRIADTRSGLGGTAGPLAAGDTATFQVEPPNSGVTAVALNVTAIDPSGVGNLAIYPAGGAAPNTSNINDVPGVDKAAFAIVALPASGQVTVISRGAAVGLALDLFGTFPSTSSVVTQTPIRALDTRAGSGTTQGLPSPLQIGTAYDVTVTGGATGVPADARSVVVSLTAIHAAGGTGVGNLAAYPAGGTVPGVSNINYIGPDADVANLAIVPIGADGQITLVTSGSVVDAAVDILGYVPAGGS